MFYIHVFGYIFVHICADLTNFWRCDILFIKEKPRTASWLCGALLQWLVGVAGEDVIIGPNVARSAIQTAVHTPAYFANLARSGAVISIAGYEPIKRPCPVCGCSCACWHILKDDTYVINCSVGRHRDKNITGTHFCGVSDFAARRPSAPKDAVGDHGCPAAAGVFEVYAAIFANACSDIVGAVTSVCSGCVEVVVCTVDELVVAPDSSFRILALNLVQDSLNVLDSGVLTVGELTSVLILVVVLGVLVLTVVVLVVVFVTGVVAVDELEHTHDDGTGLGAGHGLSARECAISHTSDDAETVAGLYRGSVVAGDAGVLFNGIDCSVALVAGDGLAVIYSDVSERNGHLVAVHGVVVYGLELVGHTNIFGNLLVGPVPGRSSRLGLLSGFNLVVVEGASEHGDELDSGDLLVGSERAVLEAGNDAELGALGHVVVVPGGALHVGEAGYESQVLVDEGVVGIGLNVVDGLAGFGVVPVDNVALAVGQVDDVAVIVGDGDSVLGNVGSKRGSNQGEAHDQGQEQGDKAGLGTHSDLSFLIIMML